jgi:hypothetical protein
MAPTIQQFQVPLQFPPPVLQQPQGILVANYRANLRLDPFDVQYHMIVNPEEVIRRRLTDWVIEIFLTDNRMQSAHVYSRLRERSRPGFRPDNRAL